MKDPVCGMDVSEKNESTIHDGKKYHFCCASCKWAFEKNPEQFVKKECRSLYKEKHGGRIRSLIKSSE